ncbi:MAG: LytR/AlgR family response regulator transcription factor [Lachnospiraceae bacterium]
MNIIAVDDEKIALEGLVESIRKAEPEAKIQGFRYAEDALAFHEKHPCDVVFLDIEMAGMGGVKLAERFKEQNPDINIIFATGYGSYREVAFELHASGYLIKPITPAKVRRELDELRRPVQSRKRIRVQAFGNFEAFLDGKPINFKYNRTKEMLAYLVDRKGALCTMGEIAGVLFEDEGGHESYLKSLRKDLIDIVNEAGCGDVIIHQRGKMGIVPDKIECDYYDWCSGKQFTAGSYCGEYMMQYSWGEYTRGIMDMVKQ